MLLYNSETIDRFIDLNLHRAADCPGVFAVSREQFLDSNYGNLIEGKLAVILLRKVNRDIGFLLASRETASFGIEAVYLLREFRTEENYRLLLRRFFDTIGASDSEYLSWERDSLLESVLGSCGFHLEEERIQLEAGVEFSIVGDPLDCPWDEERPFRAYNSGGLLLDKLREVMGSDPGWTTVDLSARRRSRRHDGFFAVKDGAEIGFAAYEFEREGREESTSGPGSILLERVAVRPGERGRGIGRALVRRVLDVGKGSGRSTIRLELARRNAGPAGLYSGLGFREARRLGRWKLSASERDPLS